MGTKLKRIPDALLARLWKGKASWEKSLRAGDGRHFRVIYPGRAGSTVGPDFRDVLLLEEGVGLVRGDVEIHVNQRDGAALGQLNGDRRLESEALEVYREFPNLQENELTREMNEQLLDPLQRNTVEEAGRTRPNTTRSWVRLVRNARRQQGLLHLHYILASPGIASLKSAPDGIEGL